jgi:cytochrome P450
MTSLTSTSSLTVLGLAVAVITILVHLNKQRTQYSRLPPGPTPHWLSGTPIPAKAPWRYFYQQSLKYGPLVTFWIGRTPVVVCNNVETANYFLEKNGRDTADRPTSMQVFSNGKRTLLVGHNDRWRRLRKGLHNALQPSAAKQIRIVQEKGAREVILDILESPQDFQYHIQTYAATLVVNMAYGRTDRARYSDPDIKKVIVASERIAVFLKPGSFKIEIYPWLKYVPGYLNQFKAWAMEELNLFRQPFFEIRDRVRAKDAKVQPCFATYLMEHQTEYQLNDDDVAYLLGSVFAAGSDTTSSALQICIMAAAMHPEAQRRVQAEIDDLVGDQPPSFDDLDKDLPLLKAFIAETFRWRPVSAGGFQHRVENDIAFKDYVLPAGTTITGNHWAIHRDESYYGPNIEDFDIDRWLTADGELKPKMRNYQYGFGRRVCPGQHVANNSVIMNCALLLWSFNISKSVGPDGKPIEIDTYAFTNTANIHPLPFKATFAPRHQNLAALIKDSH